MTFNLTNLGCQMNLSDSERIRTVLSQSYREVASQDDAHILGLMACSVRQRTIDRAYSIIHKWNKMKKERPLITFVSGCILPKDREQFVDKFDIVFSINELHSLPSLIRSQGIVIPLPSKITIESDTETADPVLPTIIVKSNNDPLTNSNISQKKDESSKAVINTDSPAGLGDYFWKTAATHSSNFEAFVPIQNGCDKFCTFCAVPYTRGREVSRPSSDILAEIKSLLTQGYKSITLLGQNVNSYGLDNRSSHNKTGELTFPRLLEQIGTVVDQYCATNNSRCLVYFTSPHPRDMTDEVLTIIAQHDSLAKQIHLPLQSADDKVLFKMNRNHSFANYMRTIEGIKRILPQASIFTDIIVGFCSETDAQFNRTADAMNDIGFAMAYIAQYSPRPGAASYRWVDDVPAQTKKERFKILSEILRRTAKDHNSQYLKHRIPILIEGIDRKGTSFVGRTEQKIPCLISPSRDAPKKIPNETSKKTSSETQNTAAKNTDPISRHEAQQYIGGYHNVKIKALYSLSMLATLDSTKNGDFAK